VGLFYWRKFNNANQLLEVNGGNIKLGTSTAAYMIGPDSVLHHKGNTSNIFVGVDAGRSNGNLASIIRIWVLKLHFPVPAMRQFIATLLLSMAKYTTPGKW
jgi:hypothetical protein